MWHVWHVKHVRHTRNVPGKPAVAVCLGFDFLPGTALQDALDLSLIHIFEALSGRCAIIPTAENDE